MEREGKEPSGSEGRSDDLFEDLDKFFASIDESEWPDADEGDDHEPDMTGGAPQPGEPGPGPEEEAAQAESGPEPEPVPAEPVESAPTREMSTEDWAHLRDVLGEEEEGEGEEDFQFTDVPTELPPDTLSPEESLFGYEGSVDEASPTDQEEPSWEYGAGTGEGGVETAQPEGGPLTLEDLKKAPPEYSNLPRDESLPPGGRPSSVDREPAPSEGAEPAEIGEPPEPSLADVEATADHLAEEFLTPPGGVEEDLIVPREAPEPARRTIKVGEPEQLMGPAWEDPTAQTVTREPPSPPQPRNLPAAVITGVALGVLALIFVFISKALFSVLAGAVILFGQLELYTTMQRRGYQPATALGLAMGGFTLAAAYLRGEPAMMFMLVVGLLLSFLWYMVAPPKARSGLVGNIGATFLGLAYVPFLAGYILVILSIPGDGRSLMLAVLGLTFANDIAAFGFGSIWGSRPLAPSISPRKSVEGLVTGTFVTIILSMAFVPIAIDAMTFPRSVGLALVVCVFAPLGDLAESLLKRDLGVKDMGNILPGHGGILDRIDSALFVVPAAFYFLRLLF